MRSLLAVFAFELDDGLQLGNLLLAKALFAQFGIHVVEADLVELVDGYGDVNQQFGRTDDVGDAGQDLAVVHLDGHADAKAAEHLVDDLDELHLVEQRVGTHHVGVTLEELAVAALLRTVGTPYGLYLVALEGECQFVLMHHHITGKGYGEVVAQALFADACSQLGRAAVLQFFGLDISQEVARVENLEEQLVAFLSVLAHQRRKVLHRGSLDLLVAVEAIDVADGVEYVVSLGHLDGREVACPLGDTWFHLCHISLSSYSESSEYSEYSDYSECSDFFVCLFSFCFLFLILARKYTKFLSFFGRFACFFSKMQPF